MLSRRNFFSAIAKGIAAVVATRVAAALPELEASVPEPKSFVPEVDKTGLHAKVPAPPPYTFASDPDTGLYFKNSDQLSICVWGVEALPNSSVISKS